MPFLEMNFVPPISAANVLTFCEFTKKLIHKNHELSDYYNQAQPQG